MTECAVSFRVTGVRATYPSSAFFNRCSERRIIGNKFPLIPHFKEANLLRCCSPAGDITRPMHSDQPLKQGTQMRMGQKAAAATGTRLLLLLMLLLPHSE